VTNAGGYLDSASSEPLHPAAREAFLAALEQGYADPRRLHGPGRNARLILDNARAVVAECLEVRPDEVTFTSSGTAAVHRGLLGLRLGRARAGESVVHSAVEHSAVLHAARCAGGGQLPVPGSA
jgi:cysteine desulfurase